MKTTDVKEPFAASGCSETLAKYRGSLTKEIANCHEWLTYLEKEMKRDADGVIPWIVVEAILKAAHGVAYEAGRTNGAVMEKYER